MGFNPQDMKGELSDELMNDMRASVMVPNDEDGDE